MEVARFENVISPCSSQTNRTAAVKVAYDVNQMGQVILMSQKTSVKSAKTEAYGNLNRDLGLLQTQRMSGLSLATNESQGRKSDKDKLQTTPDESERPLKPKYHVKETRDTEILALRLKLDQAQKAEAKYKELKVDYKQLLEAFEKSEKQRKELRSTIVDQNLLLHDLSKDCKKLKKVIKGRDKKVTKLELKITELEK